jgi:hypothetical protein
VIDDDVMVGDDGGGLNLRVERRCEEEQ